MIIQVPRGGAVHRQLLEDPPDRLTGDDVSIEVGEVDAEGNLEASSAGEVVLSVPAPESLSREADEVRRVIADAGTSAAPLIVVVEAAEELTDEELAALLDATGHTSRPVILRVIRNA